MASGSNTGLESYRQRQAQLANSYGYYFQTPYSCPTTLESLIKAKRRNTDSPNTELKKVFGIGELLESSSCLNVYTWNLDKFSELTSPSHGRIYMTSPAFTFAASKWHFTLYPSNFPEAECYGLRLVLEESKMNHQQVYWRLSLKRRYDSTTIRCTDGVHVFGSDSSVTDRIAIEAFEIQAGDFTVEDCLSVTCELRLMEDQADAIIKTETDTDTIPKADKSSGNFMQLLISGDASDVTFQVKEKNFRVHKDILGARVPAFASMFKHDMSAKIAGLVKIDDCEPDIFFIFLACVYSGTAFGICSKNAVSLYKVVDKYQLDDLKAVCLESMKRNLSVQSVCNTMALALQNSNTALLKMATDFSMKNIKSIIVTAEWQRFLRDYPTNANQLMIGAFGAAKP